MLRVNALVIVRTIVNSIHRRASQVSVGVVTRSGTNNWMDGVANCVVDSQVDNKVVETAVGGTQMLRVNALIIVRTVVLATHGRASQVSVGVETCSGTDNGMNGITNCVADGQVDNKIMETAVGGTQMLRVNTLVVVRRIVHAANRTVAEVSVGIKTRTGTDDRMYSIANCVADDQVNNQIVETAVGGAKVLCINALHIIGRIVHAANRTVAEVSVGIKTRTGTNNGMDGVTDGVVHR